MRLGKRAALLSVIAGLVFALLIPGTAWAPRVKGLPGYIGPCTMDVEGVQSDGVFVGDIFVLEYAARGDELVADLSVSGSCRVGLDARGFTDAREVSPVTVEKATCKKLQLRLGSVSVRDITVDLSKQTMDSTGVKSEKVYLCAIARAAKKAGPQALANLLNDFFEES